MALKRLPIKVPKPRAVTGSGLFGDKKGGGLFTPRNYAKQAQKSINDFGTFDFGNTGLAETPSLMTKPKRGKFKL
jgi:hypothetical protein